MHQYSKSRNGPGAMVLSLCVSHPHLSSHSSGGRGAESPELCSPGICSQTAENYTFTYFYLGDVVCLLKSKTLIGKT